MPIARVGAVGAIVAATLVAMMATAARAWEVEIAGEGYYEVNEASALAVTRGGDIIAAGTADAAPRVLKLGGPAGTIAWQRQFIGGVRSIALDRRDNAIIAGGLGRKFLGESILAHFGVIKLEDDKGMVRWRHRLGIGVATGVATDARGDVITAGLRDRKNGGANWVILKLSRNTGAEVWRHVVRGPLPAYNDCCTVLVDTRGDVVAVGRTGAATRDSADGPVPKLTVMKLARDNGHRIWTYHLEPENETSGIVSAARVDTLGDVVVAGVTASDSAGTPPPSNFSVFKLAGTSGLELWRHTITGPGNAAADVAIGRDGSVIAAGALAPAGSPYATFGVVKLAGSDGGEVWRLVVEGTAPGMPRQDPAKAPGDGASAVALDSAGNVAVAGAVTDAATGLDLLVVKIDPVGKELARYQVATGADDFARSVAIGRDDRIIVGGATSDDGERSAFTVVTFP